MNKENEDFLINCLAFTIALIIVCTAFIYYNLPKEYCVNEYNITKIEVGGIPNTDLILINGTWNIIDIGWLWDSEYIPENTEEVLCEKGAYEVYGRIESYSSLKVCLAKVATEKCEIRKGW